MLNMECLGYKVEEEIIYNKLKSQKVELRYITKWKGLILNNIYRIVDTYHNFNWMMVHEIYIYFMIYLKY